MKSTLLKHGYIYDEARGIWHRQDFAGIAYSDGDEVENRLLDIISNTTDLSVLSDELKPHCTDWPSLYHLSSSRANILRPFEADLSGDILEIGAGCGAITRYLGESGANVLALEGTPRRATIARSRTRDLGNVAVLTEKFEDFKVDKKFDVITLIGVLEYASLFTSSETPALVMLERVKSFLKPKGKLIIAIENQLGLKYFAGAPEDHVGLAMYGIEGRYRNDQPHTFGRKELGSLIKQAGFKSAEFLAPFPDYKVPVSIVTERGFFSESFDAAALAWQSVCRDPQLPPIMAFSPELVWPSIANNGLAIDLANSFLIIASLIESEGLVSSNTFAWHFTTSRRKQLCKIAKFVELDTNQVEVRYTRLDPDAGNPVVGNLLKHYLPERAEYRYGKVLSQQLMGIMTSDGWRIEDACHYLQNWLRFIATLAGGQNQPIDLSAPYSLLPESFFDFIPQNIISSDEDGFHVIDAEWAMNEKLETGYIVFRALWVQMHTLKRFGRPEKEQVKTYFDLISALMNGMEWSISHENIARWVKIECEIQSEVTGRDIAFDGVMDWLKNATLPIANLNQAVNERDQQIGMLNQSVSERDQQIGMLNQSVSERDQQIGMLNQSVSERDQQIGMLNQSVSERDQQLNKIFASKSWMVTKPFRWLGRVLRGEFEAALDPFMNMQKPKKNGVLDQQDSVKCNAFQFEVLRCEFPIQRTHSVAVIIPVYRDVKMTKRCILAAIPSVLSDPGAKLLAINDASPSEGMQEMLEQLALKWPDKFLVFKNEKNLGFVRTVNRGLAHFYEYDVVLLNSDVVVPQDWLSRLVDEAYSIPNAGTVTPFANNATICSFPYFLQENAQPFELDVNVIDAVFSQEKLPCIKAPTGVGCCMYIRRTCLDQIGYLNEEKFGRGYGEENDLCQRALKSGWLNLISPNLYVFHEGGVSFSSEKQALIDRAMRVLGELHPNYHADVQKFINKDPLKNARIARFLALLNVTNLPKVLFVTHSLGGGVNQHISDITDFYASSIVGIILYSDKSSGEVTLKLGSEEHADKLRFNLDKNYQDLLSLLKIIGVNNIHFHHTYGFSEKIYQLPNDLEVSYLATVHDFYWIGGNPTLTGEDGVFVDSITNLIHNPLFPESSDIDLDLWRSKHRDFINKSKLVIFPSHSTKLIFEKVYHAPTSLVAYHMEPLGSDFSSQKNDVDLNVTDLIGVVILGAIGKEKGADFIEKMAMYASKHKLPFKFDLLGYSYRSLENISASGPYENYELANMLASSRADLIIFPAQWPETYSYTLSAALRVGFPIVAPCIGAFPERLSGRPDTLIYDPNVSEGELINMISDFVYKVRKKKDVRAPIFNFGEISCSFYEEDYLKLLTVANPIKSKYLYKEIYKLLDILIDNNKPIKGYKFRRFLTDILWRVYLNKRFNPLLKKVPRKIRRLVLGCVVENADSASPQNPTGKL